MKKALLLLALSTTIASASFADGHLKSPHSKSVEKNGYYLRADLGTSSAQKLNDGDTYEDNKVKRANVYSLGVGKYLSKNFRTDLSASIRNYKLNSNNTSNLNQKIQAKMDFNAKISSANELSESKLKAKGVDCNDEQLKNCGVPLKELLDDCIARYADDKCSDEAFDVVINVCVGKCSSELTDIL